MNYNLNNKRWLIVLACTILPALILTGCMIPARFETDDKSTSSNVNQTVITANSKDDRLTFQGKVLSIDPSGQSFVVSVEEKDQQLLSDKAIVDLYADATVTLADTGETIRLKEVTVDSKVTVTIIGGVRESYPVQVSAVTVSVNLAKS